MWSQFSSTGKIVVTLIALASASAGANAQSVSSQNTRNFGFNLPSPISPNGHDEVRAADGTTCRSSIATSGAYLDFGGIGSQLQDSGNLDGTVYGRIVIPLGERPGRLDCRALYQLEIERLKFELKLARSSGGGGGFQDPEGDDDFQEGADAEDEDEEGEDEEAQVEEGDESDKKTDRKRSKKKEKKAGGNWSDSGWDAVPQE